MDGLLKQALCSIGITYLVVNFGQFAMSLLADLRRRRAYAQARPLDPDRR